MIRNYCSSGTELSAGFAPYLARILCSCVGGAFYLNTGMKWRITEYVWISVQTGLDLDFCILFSRIVFFLSQAFEEGVTLFEQEIELTAMSQYNRHICPHNFCSLCIEPSSSKVASTECCECDAALFSAGFLFAQPESHTCMHIKHTHTHTHNFSFVV